MIDQPVATCSRLPVTLQPQNIPHLVIPRNLLIEPVRISGKRSAFPVEGILQPGKPVVRETIPSWAGIRSRLLRHAADVSIIAGSIPRYRLLIIERLTEQRSRNTLRPRTDVIRILCLQFSVSVPTVRLQASHLIIGVIHDRHCRGIVQLTGCFQQTLRLVISMNIDFCPGLRPDRMHFPDLCRVPREVVGGKDLLRNPVLEFQADVPVLVDGLRTVERYLSHSPAGR